MESKIRVAITQRVLSPYRVSFFERLGQQQDLSVKLFYGNEIKGTKLKSVLPADGLDYIKLFTLSKQIDSSGRNVVIVFHPGLFWGLVQFNPDVILCEGSSNILNNLAVYTYAKLFRKKIIWWSLGQLADREYRGFSKIYLSFAQTMERHANAWLAYSSQGENYFLSKGYSTRKVFKAINCVDTDKIFENIKTSSSMVSELRNKYNLINKKVIIFVGSITPPKRVDRLILTFASVKKSYPETILLIVGGGKELEALKSLAAKLGVEKDVIFTGEVRENVTAYFQISDIFVLPGLGGLAIPEAMANGLPVICAQADGTEKDYVSDGITGYILPEDSDNRFVDHFAEAICKLLSHPEIINEMGKNAKRLIEQRLNINTYIANVSRCIKMVAGKLDL